MEVPETDQAKLDRMESVTCEASREAVMGLSEAHNDNVNIVVDKRVRTIDFKFFISELANKYNKEHIAKAFHLNVVDIDEWGKRSDLLRQAYHEKYGLNYDDDNVIPAPKNVIIDHNNQTTTTAINIKPEAEVGTSTDIKRKSSYNTEFKLKAVEFAEMTTNRAAAKHFNVHDKRIREWRKNKQLLLSSPKDRKRLRGAGRRPLVKYNLEPLLFEWVLMMLREGKSITSNELQEKATEMSVTALPPGNKFTAYKPWVERFLKRHSLTLIDNFVHCTTGNTENETSQGLAPPTMVIVDDLTCPETYDANASVAENAGTVTVLPTSS